ncbi:polysaccharide pyruvyl transferase family protein [uncultured Oxalicibacterium sp.]|uniref:polysaccharide pyruvyl transferase family protein n=1 Tax=uncultured Oxalicibacterium sp. TaxID=1168540 RepID=UPI0025E3E1E8|nr:polysaccharide pyruvyl transferase family protein [uncultured Oxalicibacterium sp.]
MSLGNLLQRLTGAKDEAAVAHAFPHVDLFYWKPSSNRHNFGDHLSRVIVTKMLADRQYLLDEETPQSRTLLAIGSILHFAHDGNVVWGSGVNGKIAAEAHRFNTLDVRAVRGPLTQAFLQERGIEVPSVFGDPALLTPTLFPNRFVVDTQHRYVVVPNLHDLHIVQQLNLAHVVSPLATWNRCIADILKGELVIASSLHGLILAEAYGLPARYLRLSEEENLFKYNDYVMGTGRGEIEAARSVDEALEMGGMSPPQFDPHRLMDAFPYDLWDGWGR